MTADPQDDEKRKFGEIDRLISLTIEGKKYEVPEGLELLRCFQYLGFQIAFENFCWNASCENCAADVTLLGKPAERVLCCQIIPVEGVVVHTLPEGIKAT